LAATFRPSTNKPTKALGRYRRSHVSKSPQRLPGAIESNWNAQVRPKTELAELESGELVYGRRLRGHDWENLTNEHIAQVKSELIALNIEMNLRYSAEKSRA
jgi:hypothetical protein